MAIDQCDVICSNRQDNKLWISLKGRFGIVLHMLDCRTTKSFHSDVVLPFQRFVHFQSIDVFRDRMTENDNAASFVFWLVVLFLFG